MTHPIVASARGWIGTRFHHQGRLKKAGSHKGGVDCLGFLIGVAGEMGLRGPDGKALSAVDETDYSHRPDSIRLREKLSAALSPVGVETIEPGDVLLLRIDGIPQHLAIVSEISGALGMIHAYAPARAVVEHLLDDWWKARIEAVFRPFITS